MYCNLLMLFIPTGNEEWKLILQQDLSVLDVTHRELYLNIRDMNRQLKGENLIAGKEETTKPSGA